MKWILIIISIITIHGGLFCQDSAKPEKVYFPDSIHSKPNWNNPGSYEMVTSFTKTRLSQGDSTILKVFFSGYGICQNSKLIITPSEPFMSKESRVLTSIKIDKARDSITYFGADTIPMEGHHVYITFAGARQPGWPYSTQYMDVDTSQEDLTIFTERELWNPPVRMDIKLKDKVPSGDYSINLVFTYFNGQEWRTAKETLPLHVNTEFEEREGWVFWSTVFGAGIAVLGIVLNYIQFIQGIRKNDKSKDNKRDGSDEKTTEDIPPLRKKWEKSPEEKEKIKRQKQLFNQKFVWKLKSLFTSYRRLNTE